MKTLLTLPKTLTPYFNRLFPHYQCIADSKPDFETTLPGNEKRVIIHSGGPCRPLPAYGHTGKLLTPVPVFRWGRGQKIDQTLLDLQMPLFEEILSKSPEGLNTLIAGSDALILAGEQIPALPTADVICFGQWIQPDVAQHHDIFFCKRSHPQQLSFILHNPTSEKIQELSSEYLFLLDTGIWLLSDKALKLLNNAGMASNLQMSHDSNLEIPLASNLEMSLASNPEMSHDSNLEIPLASNVKMSLASNLEMSHDSNLEIPLASNVKMSLASNLKMVSVSNLKMVSVSNVGGALVALQGGTTNQSLSIAVIPMPNGSFYPFTTSRDLLESATRLQNLVTDQREIWHRKVKPHPDIFTQNAITEIGFNVENASVWIENSHIGKNWRLHNHHVLTGIPENNWSLDIPSGQCLDLIPIDETKWCIRPYGFNDAFTGAVGDETTTWLGKKAKDHAYIHQLLEHNLLDKQTDIQFARIFPVVELKSPDTEDLIQSLLNGKAPGNQHLLSNRLSASEIQQSVNFDRIAAQRDRFRGANLKAISKNYKNSIFYQLDLNDTARHFTTSQLDLPPELPVDAPLFTRMHDQMFRAKVLGLQDSAKQHESKAFSLLAESIVTETKAIKVHPELNVMSDQIIWGRSPIRLDLAGGWSDTPPYCLFHGGKVINMAVELNGQPPLQVFIKPCEAFKITLRSIDLGVREDIDSFEQLLATKAVGSAFSIPKAALCLAGFHPDFSSQKYSSLTEQLKAFGAGIEISLLAAIPKGSGLGTSSILASTVLGALSEFCSMGWDKHEICFRTLVLEQLLTTGGGWQDQYGGVFNGIKLLESEAGLIQKPVIRWAPDHLFTQPEYSQTILLYYTGITRVAKNILAEIVRGMFLNSASHLSIIKEIKQHALTTYDAVQQGNREQLTAAINRSWILNQRLDPGTNPPETQALLKPVMDYVAGLKLLGAGGGGYVLFFAKDMQAAGRIRHQLTTSPPNNRARFVDWSISKTGFQVTRS